MQPDRHSYVPAFDGLRGVAILPVLLLHVGVNALPPGPLLRQLTRGWYGVDLFFVLSGFLITRILSIELDGTGTIDVRRFYTRRVLRLCPAYVSMLIAMLIGAVVFDPPALRRVPQVLPSLVTYTYNYQLAAGGAHFDVLVIVWSLCVEEQFYVVWPWVLRYLGARRALWFCLAATVALSTYRAGLYALLNWRHLSDPSPASAIWIYFATDTRIGVILIGCMMALSLRHRRARPLWRWMEESRLFPALALAAACVCVIFVTGGRPSSASWRSATFGYTLAAGAVAVLIAAIFAQPSSLVAGALSWQPLVSLGTISYGVYLFHTPIAWLLFWIAGCVGWPRSVDGSPFARFAIMAPLVFALTWIVALLHYRYVERRFMSLRATLKGSVQAAESQAADDVNRACIPSVALADDAAQASP